MNLTRRQKAENITTVAAVATTGSTFTMTTGWFEFPKGIKVLD